MKLRRVEFRNHMRGKVKYVHECKNTDHSDLVISVFLDQVSVHICARYECSKINHTSIRGNYSKKEKWWQFTTYRSYWPNISCTYTGGVCAMYKILSFFDQACSQKNCPQTTLPQDDNVRRQQHANMPNESMRLFSPRHTWAKTIFSIFLCSGHSIPPASTKFIIILKTDYILFYESVEYGNIHCTCI